MPGSAGELYVNITGDYSDLLTALSEAQSAAETAGEAIAQAFASGNDGGLANSLEATQSALDSFSTGVYVEQAQELTQSTDEATAALDTVEQSAGSAGSSLGDLETPLNDVGLKAKDASEEVGGLGGAFESLAGPIKDSISELTDVETLLGGLGVAGAAILSVEGLKELASEAIDASDAVTRASLSLTALTGSAEGAQETISELEDLAGSDALSFPNLLTAGERMTALLGPSADVLGNMQAIADGAAVMGTNIDSAANMFDRMAASGTANARSMTQLGLSINSLADAINAVDPELNATSDDAAKLFKAMDQSERVQVLVDALAQFQGQAQLVAQTMGGSWQQAWNEFEGVLKMIGDDIAPVITGIAELAKTISEDLQVNLTKTNDILNTFRNAWYDTANVLTEWATGTSPQVVQNTENMSAALNAFETQAYNVVPAVTSFKGSLDALNPTLQQLGILLIATPGQLEEVINEASLLGDTVAQAGIAVDTSNAIFAAWQNSTAQAGTGITELGQSLGEFTQEILNNDLQTTTFLEDLSMQQNAFTALTATVGMASSSLDDEYYAAINALLEPLVGARNETQDLANTIMSLTPATNSAADAIMAAAYQTQSWTTQIGPFLGQLTAVNTESAKTASIWPNINSAIAQGITTGQSFGTIMTKVLSDLESSIIKLALNDIEGTLLGSINDAIKGLTGLGSLTMGTAADLSALAAQTAQMGEQGLQAASAAGEAATSASDAASATVSATTQASSAASTAANAATSASSGASSAASAVGGVLSSVTGVLGAVGAVGSLVTGIIGDVQNVAQDQHLLNIDVSTGNFYASWASIFGDIHAGFQNMIEMGPLFNGGFYQQTLEAIYSDTDSLANNGDYLQYLGPINASIAAMTSSLASWMGQTVQVNVNMDGQAVAAAVVTYLVNNGTLKA